MHIKISVTDRCLVWHLSRTPSGAQSTLEMSSQCPHPACVCKDGPTVPCAGREINHGTTVASPFSVVTCARFGTQIAVLLINLAPCEVCRLSFPDLPSMQQHLSRAHKLEPNDWIPARDLLVADPVCAHCLTCFSDKAAVRQHRQHVASAPNLIPTKRRSCSWGLEDHCPGRNSPCWPPMQRLALTLKCQTCGMSFDRHSDLVLHLQTVHSLSWNPTHNCMSRMLQTCQTWDSCYCNPSTTRSVSSLQAIGHAGPTRWGWPVFAYTHNVSHMYPHEPLKPLWISLRFFFCRPKQGTFPGCMCPNLQGWRSWGRKFLV